MNSFDADSLRRLQSFEGYMKLRRWLLSAMWVTALATGAVSSPAQDRPLPTAAVPVDAVRAILDAFRSHAVVALDDVHGNEQVHAFRLSLVRDPRFPIVVNDIVVEFGNARYQDLVDRFVRGDEVPYEALRRVWQDTTQITAVWDRPIYEEFFRAVRAVNRSLPRERQLRVLLGDPPVNLDRPPGNRGNGTPQRDSYAAGVIPREVLAKQRRALVIYGGGHLFRAGQSLVSLIERSSRTKVFTVTVPGATTFELVKSLQPDVTSWAVPSMAVLDGTVLHTRELIYRDALLYLGPPSAMSFSRLSPELCSDDQYVQMRMQRLAAAGQKAIDRFRAECARPPR